MGDPSLQLDAKDLTLRPLSATDAQSVQRYAGDPSVSNMTLYIPHPYEDGMAETWIESVHADADAEPHKSCVFGIIGKNEKHLIGCIGLSLDTANDCGEIGFWIGRPFWGKGYCTQALRKVLEYGFSDLGLNCISGHHFTENPASGRVMMKVGMEFEGKLRHRKKKNGQYKDMNSYSILKEEWIKRSATEN